LEAGGGGKKARADAEAKAEAKAQRRLLAQQPPQRVSFWRQTAADRLATAATAMPDEVL